MRAKTLHFRTSECWYSSSSLSNLWGLHGVFRNSIEAITSFSPRPSSNSSPREQHGVRYTLDRHIWTWLKPSPWWTGSIVAFTLNIAEVFLLNIQRTVDCTSRIHSNDRNFSRVCWTQSSRCNPVLRSNATDLKVRVCCTETRNKIRVKAWQSRCAPNHVFQEPENRRGVFNYGTITARHPSNNFASRRLCSDENGFIDSWVRNQPSHWEDGPFFFGVHANDSTLDSATRNRR